MSAPSVVAICRGSTDIPHTGQRWKHVGRVLRDESQTLLAVGHAASVQDRPCSKTRKHRGIRPRLWRGRERTPTQGLDVDVDITSTVRSGVCACAVISLYVIPEGPAAATSAVLRHGLEPGRNSSSSRTL